MNAVIVALFDEAPTPKRGPRGPYKERDPYKRRPLGRTFDLRRLDAVPLDELLDAVWGLLLEPAPNTWRRPKTAGRPAVLSPRDALLLAVDQVARREREAA